MAAKNRAAQDPFGQGVQDQHQDHRIRDAPVGPAAQPDKPVGQMGQRFATGELLSGAPGDQHHPQRDQDGRCSGPGHQAAGGCADEGADADAD